MASLSIVWRNPSRIGTRRRWRPLTNQPLRGLYVIEELVSERQDFWVSTSQLEILSFSRAKANRESKTGKWNLGYGA